MGNKDGNKKFKKPCTNKMYGVFCLMTVRGNIVYKKVVKNIRLPISILKVMPFVISRIENNYPQYISLLSSLSKDHDRFTHSIQVMFLSLQLGIEYWITGEQLFDLWISWLFHDIWFTFIPSSYVWL